MLDFFQIIGAALCVIVAVYFGILWIRKTFEYASEINVEEKLRGSKLSAVYSSLSTLGLFLALEIYSPNVICIPFLFLFIGLFWLNYLIYKKTVNLVRKR
jgi:hypothetical protein